MKDISWRPRVYEFLSFIQKSDLEKKILDCGAGGRQPPLALFADREYECHGIDISEDALKLAKTFADKYGLELNLKIGDMRDLPYENDSFSFIFCQNTICHLTKKDQKKAIDEMLRVLRPSGVLFVDFMSTSSSYCGIPDLGKHVGNHEYHYVDDDGEDVLHVFFEDDEADSFFQSAEILKKLKISRRLSIPRKSVDVWYFYYVTKK
jgi:ubiquinone/menaquinone biosynthesis C-methylase UbiE